MKWELIYPKKYYRNLPIRLSFWTLWRVCFCILKCTWEKVYTNLYENLTKLMFLVFVLSVSNEIIRQKWRKHQLWTNKKKYIIIGIYRVFFYPVKRNRGNNLSAILFMLIGQGIRISVRCCFLLIIKFSTTRNKYILKNGKCKI